MVMMEELFLANLSWMFYQTVEFVVLHFSYLARWMAQKVQVIPRQLEHETVDLSLSVGNRN